MPECMPAQFCSTSSLDDLNKDCTNRCNADHSRHLLEGYLVPTWNHTLGLGSPYYLSIAEFPVKGFCDFPGVFMVVKVVRNFSRA
jgi:hypothetical protein